MLLLLLQRASTAGAAASAQPSQTGALAGSERYLAAIGVDYLYDATGLVLDANGDPIVVDASTAAAGKQAAQTGSDAGTERFLAVISTSQAPQTGADAGRERYLGVIAGSQSAQTDAITARTPASGVISTAQTGQTGALAGSTAAGVPVIESGSRHGARFERIASKKREKVELRPTLAIVGSVQASQRSRIIAQTNDDDLAYLFLELAA